MKVVEHARAIRKWQKRRSKIRPLFSQGGINETSGGLRYESFGDPPALLLIAYTK